MTSTITETSPLKTPSTTQDTDTDAPVATPAPGKLHVIKRNRELAQFDPSKIKVAITKAFLAEEGGQAAASTRVHEIVEQLTGEVEDVIRTRAIEGRHILIEDVQDQVELALMHAGEHKVARSYVLYREKRREEREKEDSAQKTKKKSDALHITFKDGRVEELDEARLREIVTQACEGLEDVNPEYIVKQTQRNLFDGVSVTEVRNTLVMTTRPLIEKEPNYSFVAARLLLRKLFDEACDFLGAPHLSEDQHRDNAYTEALPLYIERGIALGILDKKLMEFDLKKLGNAIQAKRDLNFTYLSLQTLYDRYFIHSEGTRYELPQLFFMRVAMGLAAAETHNKEERAIEFYNLLSSFDYMCSTPTLFNSGTTHPQLSSCFLTTVPDDLKGIYDAIRDNAMLSKFAGGIGNDWTPVRSMGAHIKGTNGKSLGVVPFMNVADATAVAVNQGGKRKGAVCGYLETWHMDVEEFLDLRKNTGDDRRRTHDMNTANWIPDLFMKRLFDDADWTLFSPSDTPDLHDLYGEAFEKAYCAYEEKAARGALQSKTIKAKVLWRKMLGMLFETGHPWVTFKDACNLRSPQQHAGVIHSSNLCTEITLNTSEEEVAVCNLGSINLVQHMNENGLDLKKLQKTVNTAVRMLDNVIDINFYTIPQARRSNLKHRPVGMGLMGFQDALYLQKTPYASDQAVEFADVCMEHISYFAINASSDLAAERGSYASYEGSLWSQGILPIDSIALLAKNRGQHLEQDTTQRLDWNALRTKVATTGMRNSNVMAIAPTATISNICGVTQSIEPTYQNLFVKSNMSGEFTISNPHLVATLKALNIWDDVMVNDIKYFNGSISKIDRIPDEVKALFATAFEIDTHWLVDAASRRQKWIDQGQSLNLYMAEPSGKKLDTLYRHAWLRGLKTTYYLRSLGATNAEKSTISDGTLNAVSANSAPAMCAIDDPECEACQ